MREEAPTRMHDPIRAPSASERVLWCMFASVIPRACDWGSDQYRLIGSVPPTLSCTPRRERRSERIIREKPGRALTFFARYQVESYGEMQEREDHASNTVPNP